MDTTLNTLLDNRLEILQPRHGYRVALDPVVVASAVPARAGQRVLDLGCGTGAASLCLLARCADLSVVGVELNPEHAALARQSAERNGLSSRMRVIDGDIREPDLFISGGLFEGVVMNPPYFTAGNTSQHPGRAVANHECETSCADWVACAATCLKPKGHLTIIQAADRLQDVLDALIADFGAIEVIPLWPKAGREAKRVLVRAVKGRKTPLRLCAGLVLHEADGTYTRAADAILRGGASLDATLNDDYDER